MKCGLPSALYYWALYRLMKTGNRSIDDAEDVLQEGLLRFLQSEEPFEPLSPSFVPTLLKFCKYIRQSQISPKTLYLSGFVVPGTSDELLNRCMGTYYPSSWSNDLKWVYLAECSRRRHYWTYGLCHAVDYASISEKPKGTYRGRGWIAGRAVRREPSPDDIALGPQAGDKEVVSMYRRLPAMSVCSSFNISISDLRTILDRNNYRERTPREEDDLIERRRRNGAQRRASIKAQQDRRNAKHGRILPPINWKDVRRTYESTSLSQSAIAEQFGLSQAAVSFRKMDEGWQRRIA